MRTGILILLLCLLNYCSKAQKFQSEKGTITFFSHATLEDIAAENRNVSSLFNTATLDVVFSVPIAAFRFEKSLMQQHFNEKYLESEKYPTATFQGKVTGYNLAVIQVQPVTAQGKLTIHGVTHEVEVAGTIEKNGGKLILKSRFIVKLKDYQIAIPQLLWQNIAEQVEVEVDLHYTAQ